jgi:hypothetical protein
MNSRVIIVLVAAAILLAVLVPAIVFVATVVLLLVAPTLVIAQCDIDEVFGAQSVLLRSLTLFRAPPARRV